MATSFPANQALTQGPGRFDPFFGLYNTPQYFGPGRFRNPANTGFTATSPYFGQGELNTKIGSGQPYGPTANLGDMITNHLLQMLSGQNPDQARTMSTYDATANLGRGLPTTIAGPGGGGLYEQERGYESGPIGRQQAFQEQGRTAGLLQTLMGQSGVDVGIESQRMREEAAMRQLQLQQKKAREALWGQIPIVGRFLQGAM